MRYFCGCAGEEGNGAFIYQERIKLQTKQEMWKNI